MKNNKTFRPMLCASLEGKGKEILDLSPIKYPAYVSHKLDGIRAIVYNGEIVSRNLKPIPNKYIRSFFKGRHELEGLDGELIVGEPNSPGCYRTTISAVMSEDGEPDFTFYVFDRVNLQDFPSRVREDRFTERLLAIDEVIQGFLLKSGEFSLKMAVLEHKVVGNVEELLDFEQNALENGYEGVIINSINGVYKMGRSTLKEGYAIKLKRFSQDEAKVVGFTEQMENTNEKTESAIGLSERSSHKDNMLPKDTLGALVVKSLGSGKLFSIGTGFDDATRKEIWRNQEAYLDRIVTFKHFEIGNYDVPRFPVFIGFRDESDM